jgi:hypothetical protein
MVGGWSEASVFVMVVMVVMVVVVVTVATPDRCLFFAIVTTIFIFVALFF